MSQCSFQVRISKSPTNSKQFSPELSRALDTYWQFKGLQMRAKKTQASIPE